jgi:hypothetical protein
MAFYEEYSDEFPKQKGSFVPDTNLYLGFIARAVTQETTPGGAMYVKKVKYTTLETLKATCTAAALDRQV